MFTQESGALVPLSVEIQEFVMISNFGVEAES